MTYNKKYYNYFFRDSLPTKDNLLRRGVIDQGCACLVVAPWNHQIIYFYIVIFLDPFGTSFIDG